MFVFTSFSVTVLLRCNCCKFNHLKIVYYTLFFSAKQWECREKNRHWGVWTLRKTKMHDKANKLQTLTFEALQSKMKMEHFIRPQLATEHV